MVFRNTRTTGRQTAAGRSSGSHPGSQQPAGTTWELEPGVRRTVLPSGLRVVTEEMPGVRSAAVGVWVGVGSRDEDAVSHGCSHFLEHLLFKGTPTRTALEISEALDAVGGEFNAFTAKEYTCFHARVLDEDLQLAVDVLGDMVTSSLITPEDVEAERDVILDEIAMHDDDPDDVVHNLFAAQAWGEDSPLGRGIAGTEESISALSRDQIHTFYGHHYRATNLVVSAAGNLRHDEFVALVERAFAGEGFLDGTAEPVAPRGGPHLDVRPGVIETQRPLEQVNLILGMEGLRRDDDRRFSLGVLNTALGGGTSSRLFQEVRERRGLAYSVFSFTSSHAESGLLGVSVGCLPGKLDAVLATVRTELERVAVDGITEREMALGKGQLRGGLVLGLEDSGARMMRLGKAELVHDELLTLDDVLTRIAGVTVDDCRAIAGEVLTRPELLAIVGPA